MHEKSLVFDEDWKVVESLLPEGWEEKAKELGAYQRKRRFGGPGPLLRTLLIHVAEGRSYRETATRAEEGGLADVTDVALVKRLRHGKGWLQWMAAGVVDKWLRTDTPEELDGPMRVKVADATTVQEPGAKGISWRIHYSLQLPNLVCDEVKITDQKGAESFSQFSIQSGDLWLGDRIYAHRSGIHHVVSQGGDVLVRVGVRSMILEDEDGQRFDLMGHIRTLKHLQVGDWPVVVRYKTHQILGRICAVKLGEAATRKARKRIVKENKKKGKKTRPETLDAAGFIIVFTTLDPTIPAATILSIYRVRWQVELTFKRLKSLLGTGHLHNKNTESAKAWLYGKLLTACLIEALPVAASRFFPWGYPLRISAEETT